MAETKGKFRVGDLVGIRDISESKFDLEGNILYKWANDCMGSHKDEALAVLKNFSFRENTYLAHYTNYTNHYIVRGYIMKDSEYRYIIESMNDSRVYITLESNLVPRAKRMTKAEIEAKLGYKIEIVEEEEN